MEDLPLGRIAALVPEFAVKDLPLGRTLMMMILHQYLPYILKKTFKNGAIVLRHSLHTVLFMWRLFNFRVR